MPDTSRAPHNHEHRHESRRKRRANLATSARQRQTAKGELGKLFVYRVTDPAGNTSHGVGHRDMATAPVP